MLSTCAVSMEWVRSAARVDLLAVTSIARRAVGDISGIAATEVGTFGVLQTLRIDSTATVINGAKVDDFTAFDTEIISARAFVFNEGADV